jgi:hypothetical protein
MVSGGGEEGEQEGGGREGVISLVGILGFIVLDFGFLVNFLMIFCSNINN